MANYCCRHGCSYGEGRSCPECRADQAEEDRQNILDSLSELSEEKIDVSELADKLNNPGSYYCPGCSFRSLQYLAKRCPKCHVNVNDIDPEYWDRIMAQEKAQREERERIARKKAEEAATPAMMVAAESYPVTGTKILANLGEPELAEKIAKLPCDGIGLMREEFIWSASIGQHPLYLIETGQSEKVINGLAEGVAKLCRAMNPRPVVLRFSDFKSSEYRDLKGGEKYEPVEPSALLGWRGASRYYDPKYTEAFKLEVRAVKKIREEYGLKNLWVMLPFVRTVAEAEKVIKIIEGEGLKRSPDFKIWLMAEIPSNIILADKFNKFVDGYSIGSNDLTMLILGCDRDNPTVSDIFDERNLAVKRALRHLIDTAHKDGKTVSICGQAPSVHGPDFIRFLVESGIDSISVNPDAVVQVRKWTAAIEQRLMLEKIMGRGLAEDTNMAW